MMSMIWLFYFIEIVISTSCGPDGSSSRYNETIIGAQRIILSSGCPNHHDTCVGRPGVCTNRRSGISLGVTLSNATNKEVSIPAYPCINSASGDGVDITCTGGEIGIMLNGVSLFSQTAGGVECPDAVVAEAATFNMCGGHATPYGEYHYHLAPGCLLHQLRDYGTLNPYNRHSPLIGWAYDGFPIYGPHGNDGTYIYKCNHPNANLLDCLDSCNGHRQHTIDGFKYHYHVTGPVGDLSGDIVTAQLWPYPDASMSPYTIGCFRGMVTNKWNSTFRQLTCVENGTVDGYQAKKMNGVSHLIYPEQIPEAKGCDKQDLTPTSGTLDDFTITFHINCNDDTVSVIIEYSSYTDNWFGIVFSQTMIGDALIYTTGDSNQNARNQRLYAYELNARSSTQVIYDSDKDWTKISEMQQDGSITVEYQQDLSKTAFDRETEIVYIRWAFGTSLALSQHSMSDRSSSFLALDLMTGETSQTDDDRTLETIHGVLMWTAWSLFAPIGIMTSAFRWIFPKGPLWFFIHRGVQICVVLLTVIGFIIALIFTADMDKPHFHNNHMIIGLVVVILTVLQPMNALCRGHPAGPGEQRTVKRIIWEIVHKTIGYGVWILACYAIYLGLELMDKDTLSALHAYLWCPVLLGVYIICFIAGHCCVKHESKTAFHSSAVKENERKRSHSAHSIQINSLQMEEEVGVDEDDLCRDT